MKRIAAFLVCISLLSTLPLFSIRKDTKLILDELQKLNDRVDALETAVSGEISTMKKKVDIILDKVGAITKNQADTNQDKENLLLSLQFIKEELNELKNNLNKVNDRLVSMPTGGIATGVDIGDSQEGNSNIQAPENIYYTAYSDYIKKNYDYAIEGFKQFLKLYPNNGLADNSLYWIGECYYAQKKYQEAVNVFSQLISTYSEGDKIPDATLKKGFGLIEMGKQTEGIEVLKELTSKFPLSEEASLAQQKIREVMD